MLPDKHGRPGLDRSPIIAAVYRIKPPLESRRSAVQRYLALLPVVAVLATASADAQAGYGQISLDNQTSATANLYVDGQFGCGPVLARGFCTTQVKIGTHDLEAKLGSGGYRTKTGVQLKQGQVITWKIEN